MSHSKLLAVSLGLLAACQVDTDPIASADRAAPEPFAFAALPAPVDDIAVDDARAMLARAVEPGETLLDDDVRVRPLATGGVLIEGTAVSDESARRITLDATGAPVDGVQALAMHRAARFAQLGKLDETLRHAVLHEDGDHRVVVRLDVDVPAIDLPEDAAPDDLERFERMMQDHRARISDMIAAGAEPIERWLDDNGAADVQTLRNLPVIVATVDARLLRSRFLNEHPAVASIDMDTGLLDAIQPMHAHAGVEGAMRGRFFNGGGCGSAVCRGLGLKAAVWENSPYSGTGDIGWYNPRLYDTTTPPHIARGLTCSKQEDCGVGADLFCLMTSGPNLGEEPEAGETGRCINEHTSAVAYMIGTAGLPGGHNQDGKLWTDGYGAYRTPLLVANENGEAGLDWAIDGGALYVNRSQGVSSIATTSSTVKAIDWAVRHQYVTVTAAAGNDEESTAGPEHSYNAISVGAYRYGDWNTLSDDAMAGFSSYLNGDFGLERPHLVAPGHQLEVPSVCTEAYKKSFGVTEDWISDRNCDGLDDGFSGTSFASPAALGAVIQTHQRAGLFSPLFYPGMRKAVLMAGAQDVAGDGAVTTPGVDSKDGAGAINMHSIRGILDNVRYKIVNVKASDFGWIIGGKTVAEVNVPAGYALRAVMVQNSCPDATSNDLTADLDLWVTHVPSSIYVPGSPTPPSSCYSARKSVSSVNEFEMVMQDCLRNSKVGNTFAIKIQKKSGTAFGTCNGASSEPVYVAWDLVKLPTFKIGTITWW